MIKRIAKYVRLTGPDLSIARIDICITNQIHNIEMIQIKSRAKIMTREIGSNVKFVGCKTSIVQQSDSCNGKFNFKARKLCQLRKRGKASLHHVMWYNQNVREGSELLGWNGGS